MENPGWLLSHWFQVILYVQYRVFLLISGEGVIRRGNGSAYGHSPRPRAEGLRGSGVQRLNAPVICSTHWLQKLGFTHNLTSGESSPTHSSWLPKPDIITIIVKINTVKSFSRDSFIQFFSLIFRSFRIEYTRWLIRKWPYEKNISG